MVRMLSKFISLSIAETLLAWLRFTTKVDISALVPIPAGSAQLPEYIPSTKALCLFVH